MECMLRMNGRVVLSLAVFYLIFSVQTMAQTRSSDGDIVYEVFVQSFCDSNGDGIGDLPGLITKLDYIRDLGATAVWLMPVHPSPSYHKYDVTDFYGIHPDYGTMKDMEQLIAEAHRRKLKVILDLVINHTSSEHPWFKESAASPQSPYRQYYVWRNIHEVKDELEKKNTTFDSDNLTQWHSLPNAEEGYYGFFWKGMPDLNFDYRPVREEVYTIGKFWLDKGIDGFRLDAAKHIYPDDRLDDTRKFWEEFRHEMEKVKPDVKIIGEVWADPVTLASLFSGLPSLFNFELTKLIPNAIQSKDPRTFISHYSSMHQAYEASGQSYEDATLLSNHDMDRVRSTLGDDLAKSKLAASLLLTLPGTPYLYYGEEIGMLGKKPDKFLREPFLWSKASAEDTTWLKPHFSISPAVTPLADQLKDPNSIYHHYHQWIALRREHQALQKGTITFIPPEYPHVLGYMRTTAKERIMVLHNLDDQEVDVRVMDPFKLLTPSLQRSGDQHLVIPAYGSALLLLTDN